MDVRLTRGAILAVLATLPFTVRASHEPDRSQGRRVEFIGVFHPVVTGFSFDPNRCPDPSHPLLLTFRGEAFTTLGHATFEQSHCEGLDHTSFRRGEQAITFANGDKLFGVYSGVLLQTPTTPTDGRLVIDGFYRNMGGTGGLERAHGRGISSGVVDTATGNAEVTVSGTL